MKGKLIHTIWLSEKRRKIMQLLLEGSADIEEIKSTFNVTSRLIMPQIKQLEIQNIVINDNGLFRLSNFGELIFEQLLRIIDTELLLDEDRDYWNNRNLDSIPPHMYKRLGDLNNYFLYEYDVNDVFEVPLPLQEEMLKTNQFFILTSYFHPYVLRLTFELVESGVEVIGIFTESVFERMKTEFRGELSNIFDFPNIDISIIDKKMNPPAIFLTDRFMLIGFFNKKGICDEKELMSSDESALNWGRELFSYYKKHSKQVTD